MRGSLMASIPCRNSGVSCVCVCVCVCVCMHIYVS